MEWLEGLKVHWTPAHADDVVRSLERDVFPAIGKFPIAGLTPPMILKVLRAIETRGSIETAKRIRQRISAVFVYAIAEGFATRSSELTSELQPLMRTSNASVCSKIKRFSNDVFRLFINNVNIRFMRQVYSLTLHFHQYITYNHQSDI